MTKNNIAALKEEELDKVQGGSITLLTAAFITCVTTAVAAVTAVVKAKSDKK